MNRLLVDRETVGTDANTFDAVARQHGIETRAHSLEDKSCDRSQSLVWSEHCYLLCIALALALIIIPHEWSIPARRVLRQIPLLATLPIALLCIAGYSLGNAPSRRHTAWQPALTALLPFTVLSAWIITGSIYARFVEHYTSTFLNLGTNILAAPAAALILLSSNAPTRLAAAFMRLIVAAALIMAIGLIIVMRRFDIYHEQIFLAIPVAVACALSRKAGARGWIGAVFFLAIAILSVKNTSYIIAMISLVYIAFLLWLNGIQRSPSVTQIWLHYIALMSVAALGVAVAVLIYYREHYLPSGNVEFRTFTYKAAWQQFLDSPWWGTSFATESVRKFTLYTIGVARNRLPTHSDVLDLLANGGLFAAILWITGYFRVAQFAYRRILAPRFLHYPWAAHTHTLAAISLAAIVTYAFNPILLQTEIAFMVWTTLGFLVGIAASCDPEQRAGDIARRFHTDLNPLPRRSLYSRTS